MANHTSIILIGCGMWQAGQGGAKCRAAGAVLTKDVAPWAVVGGNPAKFIKNRELVEK